MGFLSLSLNYVLLFLVFHTQVSSSSSSSFDPQCHPDESSARLRFGSSFISSPLVCVLDPFGAFVQKQTSWNESTNCCTSWGGITCDSVTGHVIGLHLCMGIIKDTLSSNSSLFFLRHLQTLVLTDMDFGGSPILPEFGQFKNLTYLDMSYSNFMGHVPLEISHLSRLVHLKLAIYFFYAPIIIGDDTFKAIAKNLTRLRVLELFYIDMSSVSLVSLMNMSSLTSLHLSSSKLLGELPESTFQMPKLEEIDLAGNNLSGRIPCSFLNLHKLRTFDLSDNYFTGQLPEVCSNSLQKSPSDGYSNHQVHSVPSSLISLKLSRNFLNGPIPSWIHELPYLAELDLHDNHFTGTIEFARLSKNLNTVDLSSNNLSLSFNNSMNYTFDNLHSLYLRACNITEFPHFLRYSKRLRFLDLSFNQIQGSVPKWLSVVSKDFMYYLDLSHNSLTHIETPRWDYLGYLDLSSNRFSGPLPISSARRLGFLMASNNQFSGNIPTSICFMTYLEIVVLSHNNLSGNIPQCMGDNLKVLKTLDLRMNRLQGPIPATSKKINFLSNINLNGNQLEGPLPRSLEYCGRLQVLDLGNNQIKDAFPNWLESLPWLQVLVLRANKFYGIIGNPKTKSPFRELRIMDISYNKFRGALPTGYIENFKAMMDAEKAKMDYMGEFHDHYYFYSIVVSIKGLYVELERIQTILTTIDFSSNNFNGEIPKSIGRLESLKGLNFSHNELGGIIPSSLGNLTNLEWLDLSSNELVGRIPYQLAGIPWLAFLNLSQNQLVGPIPTGRQFNTFNTDSYSGNPGLCGFPLSKCGRDEAPHNQDDDGEHDDGMFEWKVVMMGYGSGTVIGISVGYMVLFSRRGDYWFQKRFGREPRHLSIAPLSGRRRRRN